MLLGCEELVGGYTYSVHIGSSRRKFSSETNDQIKEANSESNKQTSLSSEKIMYIYIYIYIYIYNIYILLAFNEEQVTKDVVLL